jgi:hypothetical protein
MAGRSAWPPYAHPLALGRWLLDGDPQGIQAITLTPCEVLLLPRPTVLALLEHAPSVTRALATRLSQHLRAAAALSARLARRHAHAQVAQVVLSAVRADGAAPTPGATRALPLACRDLPELTGLARGTIHRVLRDFQQTGALEVVGGQLHILDVGHLVQVQGRRTSTRALQASQMCEPFPHGRHQEARGRGRV